MADQGAVRALYRQPAQSGTSVADSTWLQIVCHGSRRPNASRRRNDLHLLISGTRCALAGGQTDKLPELGACRQLNCQFHQILISLTSWILVAASQQERALRKLSNLLLPGGTLIFAQCTDAAYAVRESASLALETLNQQAKKQGLQWQVITAPSDCPHPTPTLFQLPDDGSGALARIRHIAVNDSKSSTYKLALLRTLVRIADAHPGAIKDRNDGQVAISLGLVAYYWIRLFKRLLDAGLQQNANTSKGLGFVKEDGWDRLTHLKANDLVIGALFTGDDAAAIQALFKDTIATIQTGPAKFIPDYHHDSALQDYT